MPRERRRPARVGVCRPGAVAGDRAGLRAPLRGPTLSLQRRWPCFRESLGASRWRPGATDIAGNPPAVASATPGVLKKNVSVIRKVAADIAAPNAEKMD